MIGEEVIEGDDTDDKSAAIFDRKAPLSSVFNILYGRSDKNSYRFNMLKDISYPTSKIIHLLQVIMKELK